MLGRALVTLMNWFWRPGRDDAIGLARLEAVKWGNEYVGTESLLLALATMTNRPVGQAMIRCGIDQDKLRREINRMLTPPPPGVTLGVAKWRLPLTPRVKWTIERALVASQTRGAGRFEAEDLLLALLDDSDTVAFQLVANLTTVPDLKRAVLDEAGWNDSKEA